LLPTYNEEPTRVFSRVRAILHSLDETSQSDRFDFYVLSDSTDAETWILEEEQYLRLRVSEGIEHLYYRHRRSNAGRKAGNIAEWISRFGGHYDFMIVLDADSLMSGDTLVRLTGAMEKNSNMGLIQTVPYLLGSATMFARNQQFANRIYGPLMARGISWWHGAETNYWGHNAIIRVPAFAAHAGLPVLDGRKPFGGSIMSHDFVEAGLLRRGGWAIHLITNLKGSFEECPPTLTDYALRDRRWCQGNLQHLAVLPARGLHYISRLHLLTGIGCYVTAPLWLLFLLVGILISLQAQFIRPEYFPSGATLFPHWPAQDPVRATWVFAGTMALLFAPKIIGYFDFLLRMPTLAMRLGKVRLFASVFLETIVSALIAPIMMVMQSKAIVEIVSGRDSGWTAQRRDSSNGAARDTAKCYVLPTVAGLALGAAAYSVSDALVLWMLPVILGLAFAGPIAILVSSHAAGIWLRKMGVLVTPEEQNAPAIARFDDTLECSQQNSGRHPIELLTENPCLLRLHVRNLLPAATPRPAEINSDLVLAQARISAAESRDEAIAALNNCELMAVLNHEQTIRLLLSKPHITPTENDCGCISCAV
jgi:membrane glycosyltransferase